MKRSLKYTRSLPPLGEGYRSYSWFANALGRQHAHHLVMDTLLEGFGELHEAGHPTFEVSEIGWPRGGRFLPHRSHRTGMSVDIMTPMKYAETERSARLRTNPVNLFGYLWHIDDASHRLTGLAWDTREPCKCRVLPLPSRKEVDFDAMRALIIEMEAQARSRGGRITKVYIDPSFERSLRGVGVVLKTKPWIQHDDHIHLEFWFKTPQEREQ